MRFFTVIFIAAVLMLGVGCHTAPRATSAEMRAKHPDWPLTVDGAVTRLLAEMSEADKAAFRAKKKEQLIDYHFSLGLYIRNYYGLNGNNYSLMADCHTDIPDGASMVIIEAAWQRLQSQ
jgi:hypothetical protein